MSCRMGELLFDRSSKFQALHRFFNGKEVNNMKKELWSGCRLSVLGSLTEMTKEASDGIYADQTLNFGDCVVGHLKDHIS